MYWQGEYWGMGDVGVDGVKVEMGSSRSEDVEKFGGIWWGW